ncbi:MAG: holo-ACP synthase [Desulfovibrionaceae bacterium]|nr:holo-ACP synthase [Desulfovibrionaceae bacterium]
MILGTGCDITEIERIKQSLDRFGDHFLDHILSPKERTYIHGSLATFLAGRFAAKEACAKAFGTGFQQGLTMTQIEIENDPLGCPRLNFTGYAQELAQHKGLVKSFLSISHEQRFAIAFVVFEG